MNIGQKRQLTTPESDREELERFFIENVHEWADVPNIGVKFLELDAYIGRNLLAAGEIMNFWREVSALLPKDTMIVRMGSSEPFILQAVSDGAYRDAKLISVGSIEWPRLADGEPIPVLVAEFEGNHVVRLK